MTAALADVDRVLALDSVRGAAERTAFLSTVRDLGREDGAFTYERLQQLLLVAGHFQALLARDQGDYLVLPVTAQDGQRDFAVNIQRTCLEIANGCQRFLRSRHAWADSVEARQLMPRVTGLALAAIHCFVKWGYFLQETGRPTPWKQMHALYALAEGDGYARSRFGDDPAAPFETSVQSAYLRALMLGLLNAGNLSKAQVEIADGWLAAWCSDYSLDTEFSSRDHRLCVDLASDTGLMPIHAARQSSMRFLRAEALATQIEAVHAALRQGRVFAGRGAGAIFPIEEHMTLLAILEKLHQAIIARGDNRIDERRRLEDREVDVVVGMERVLRKTSATSAVPAAAVPAASSMQMLDASPDGVTALTADPQFAAATIEPRAVDPEIDRWRVYDLSSKGFGLLVDRAAAESVPLNGIIALRNHANDAWIAATVVRKQPSREHGQVLIGVEVLAYRVIPVELRGTEAPVRALYLPGNVTDTRRDSVVLRLPDFRAGNRYALRAGGSDYRVRLNRIVRKGSDWIKARFEVESTS